MSIPRNPYFYLPITYKPETFYGSKEWVHVLLEVISGSGRHSQISIQLLGLPGMGKSTLLRYIADYKGALEQDRDELLGEFRNEPYLLFTVLVGFRSKPPDEHPFLYLHHQILQAYHEYRRYLKEIQKDLHLGSLPDTSEELEDSSAMGNAIEANLSYLVQHGIRPVLLLDDFDWAFKSMTLDETTRMRPWRDMAAMVLAIEKSLERVNSLARGSPVFQIMPLIRMDGLSPAEARVLLSKPAEQEGFPFPSEDIEFVLRQADHHLYLLILAGTKLWEMRESAGLIRDPKEPLNERQRALLIGQLQVTFHPMFKLYWEEIDEAEQKALIALALDEVETSEMNFAYALASLAGRGLVEYDPQKGYEMFSPLFKEFVKREILSEEGSAQIPIEGTAATPESASEVRKWTGLETSLYDYLRMHAQQVCSFEDLWRDVWKEEPIGEDEKEKETEMRRRIQVTASRLRAKLKEDARGEDILSVRGQGYRLVTTNA